MASFQKKAPAAKPALAAEPTAAADVAPATIAPAFGAPVDAAEAEIAASTGVAEQISAQSAVVKENVRKATEDSVLQGRAAYDRVKTAAEDATGSLEASYATAAKGLTDFNAKIFGAMRAHGAATFDLVKALSTVKSMDEMAKLHAEHARKQYETLALQAKEFGALAQKVAADAVAPLKAGFDRTVAAR